MVYVHAGAGFEALRGHINKDHLAGNHAEEWRNLPEIPTASEIWSTDSSRETRPVEEEWNSYMREPSYEIALPHNIIEGPWPSKAEYLGAHYQILREDVVAPLRHSVASVKDRPDMMEDNETHIYTHVTMKGMMLSPVGPAFRVEFSTERAGKQIRWEQSKRLMQGTLVAISSHKDSFRTSCKVAVIAARPLVGGVDQNPPQVDIFWGDNNDAVFDPDEHYIMVEARTGYFEASRHMLVAIQKLMTESFALAKHIVDLDSNVTAPTYVEDHSIYDLSSLLPPEKATEIIEGGITRADRLQNVDLLDPEAFPKIPESGMDPSQLLAFKSMMNKKVAIVQGPPGTGKTFVSVSALKVMLANLQPDEPPIIVAAQTNHALDQLLNHVLKFEPNILRLGGRCDKGNIAILERTLYQLKHSDHKVPSMFQGLKDAQKRVASNVEAISEILNPLVTSKLVTAEMFLNAGVIRQEHYDSLNDDDWTDDGDVSGGLESWLREDQIYPILRTPQNDTTLPLEEGEVEQEVVLALDQEVRGEHFDREADKDGLTGTYVRFNRMYTGRNTGVLDDDIKKLLRKHRDLQAVPHSKRGDMYRYLLKQLDRNMRKKMKLQLSQYNDAIDKLRLTKWSLNAHFIRHMRIKLIGCTTTGLSKYRGLLAAVQPRTLLIEEAAETKEGTIIAGMIETLQHLILVGDHQQLQANCNVKALEEAPYHMNISMFERLVRNSIGFVMLNEQRRMVPNIRKLLTLEPIPFYENLQDHRSVLDRKDNRPLVPGMGDRDVHFFSHNWPECRNPDSSRYNPDEAQMIAGAFKHLILNGTEASKITVLTFYNGQRKRIVQELKNTPGLEHVTYFNVFTVDSFQGEENDIILLSLVRSNEHLSIGFLDNKNRLVVALSRARRGLYIFGNALTLTAAESNELVIGRDPLWDPLLQHLKRQRQFKYGAGFPITCIRHGKTIEIAEPQDWALNAGGCNAKCDAILPCGHFCTYNCHSFPESDVPCREACPLQLPCGHGCSRFCYEACTCDQCTPVIQTELEAWNLATDSTGMIYTASDVRSGPERALHESSPSSGGSSERGRNGRFTMRGADGGKTDEPQAPFQIDTAVKVLEADFKGKHVNDKSSPLRGFNSSNGTGGKKTSTKSDPMRKGAFASRGDAPHPKSAGKPEPVVQSYRSSPSFFNKSSNPAVEKKDIASDRQASGNQSGMSIVDLSPLSSPKSISQEEKTSHIRVSKTKKAENGHANRVDGGIIAPVANPSQEPPPLIDFDEPWVHIGIDQSVIPESWRI
ncbi:Helicase required for RNAi-mediated heterochromatin assembly [Lachnellula willkommii]|uniref:Helicase required for RNAi-mediated heterochromatin assembly n=1 Tax=Lachnellula willkommii TaxID=215461 RepID=A0A559M8B1_9HELO|nr:Helicase required for RNAi-mediated heterochromatin assembly [Lachnellula willkommii]